MPTNPGTSGLVAWWALGEASGDRLDSHGANDLSPTNAPGSAAGLVGNAVDCETSATSCLTVADNAALSVGGNDPITISLWVKPESLFEDEGIAGKWNTAGGTSEYALLYLSGKVLWAVRNSAETQLNLYATSHGAFTVGAWHLIIAWYDPADSKTRIQINDGTVNVSASTLSGGVRDGANAFWIGRYHPAGNAWDGLIDEASVWRRVLTADERTWLYNAGAGQSYADVAGGSAVASIIQAHGLYLGASLGGG